MSVHREEQFKYMIKREEGHMPTLLRLDLLAERKAFILDIYEHGLCWVYTPELDQIVKNRNRFPEYSDISEEEAAEIEKQFQEEHDRIEKELNIINVEHIEKQTEKGVVNIDIYRKGKERPNFHNDELEKILYALLEKENLKIRKINYTFSDIWGYPKYRTSTSKEDIPKICDMPWEIFGTLYNRDKKCWFIYLSEQEIVKVAICPKSVLAKDFKFFFDDTVNE